jgi:GrpB-like predicted nucleotidyltransferase (UPF0157 family)
MALAMPLPDPGPVVIADYDLGWPRMYEAESRRIVEAIGEWLVDIQHVGSTSVPGLAAKPVIDMMPGVETFGVMGHIIPRLESLGYEHVPVEQEADPISDRRYFRRGVPRSHHVHVTVVGSDFWVRHLAFRDYLRAHPETATEYAALKRRLASEYGSDRLGYVHAKTDFITVVEELALAGEAS